MAYHHGAAAAKTAQGGLMFLQRRIQTLPGAPATVELDGKQYLLVSGGNSLFAYALPQLRAATEDRHH